MPAPMIRQETPFSDVVCLKVIVLGGRGVGCTSFVRRLCGKVLRAGRRPTLGVERSRVPFGVWRGQQLVLDVWDVGSTELRNGRTAHRALLGAGADGVLLLFNAHAAANNSRCRGPPHAVAAAAAAAPTLAGTPGSTPGSSVKVARVEHGGEGDRVGGGDGCAAGEADAERHCSIAAVDAWRTVLRGHVGSHVPWILVAHKADLGDDRVRTAPAYAAAVAAAADKQAAGTARAAHGREARESVVSGDDDDETEDALCEPEAPFNAIEARVRGECGDGGVGGSDNVRGSSMSVPVGARAVAKVGAVDAHEVAAFSEAAGFAAHCMTSAHEAYDYSDRGANGARDSADSGGDSDCSCGVAGGVEARSPRLSVHDAMWLLVMRILAARDAADVAASLTGDAGRGHNSSGGCGDGSADCEPPLWMPFPALAHADTSTGATGASESAASAPRTATASSVLHVERDRAAVVVDPEACAARLRTAMVALPPLAAPTAVPPEPAVEAATRLGHSSSNNGGGGGDDASEGGDAGGASAGWWKYFAGPIDRARAEYHLRGGPPGTFLLRRKSTTALVLSYVSKAGKARHAVIESSSSSSGGEVGVSFHVGGKTFDNFEACWTSVRQVAKHGLRFRFCPSGSGAAMYELEPGQSARGKKINPTDLPASPFVDSS